MPCFGPLTGYYAAEKSGNGKRRLVFDRRLSHSGVGIKLPCGQCIGCRLEKSRQWAVRCMHEKSLYTVSSFLTITYDDEHVPADGSLKKRDLQLFMKRLRKEMGDGVRFYACGEYGDTTGRPHYHLLLFNVDFPDKRKCGVAKRGEPLYTSETVDRLWPYGRNWIGAISFDSCAYVARYILKKVSGPLADVHYGLREPEFTVMSRRPGIGYEWYRKYGDHSYEWDSVVMNGKEMRPPKYYDSKYELEDSDRLAVLKVRRRRMAMLHRADNTKARLRARETFEIAKKRVFLSRS